jgi:hypothetical protein
MGVRQPLFSSANRKRAWLCKEIFSKTDIESGVVIPPICTAAIVILTQRRPNCHSIVSIILILLHTEILKYIYFEIGSLLKMQFIKKT